MIKPIQIKIFLNSIIKSYSQVFFSDNIFFAVILILVSFIDYQAGLAGLICVLTTNILASLFKFNNKEIENGMYGFNSLLVGMGLGSYFAPSVELYIFIAISAFLTIMFVNFFKGLLLKYQLPYLSLPFIFSLWIIMLASRYFPTLGISERGIFTFNTLYNMGGHGLVELYEKITSVGISAPVKTYFISMAAIFFQYTVFSGILISIGLLIFSRIALLLSVTGFISAYYFYFLLGGNIADLSYSYIGFNFILTAIAIGGFFLIPSVRSFLWTIFLIPVVILLTVSLSQLFTIFRLPIYSLPFNMVVLLFLYTLKFRMIYSENLSEVIYQFNNPENNFYYYLNQKTRNSRSLLIPFRPPFHGSWTVSQGHDGEITHKEDWKYAWDFVITDKNDKEFENTGLFTDDYYCFGKSVLAPANGTIEKIINHIPDNEIGKYNLRENWGNTVVIKHDDHIYSSLNHLKNGSVKVKTGDTVKQGQKIAEAGNSGRSPYPHLHFQIQNTPYIGSKTLIYPLGFYINNLNNKHILQTYSFPKKNDIISPVDITPVMKNAYDFIPGKLFKITGSLNNNPFSQKWEILTDAYNNSYIYNHSDGSSAWFHKNDYQIYFTYFKGNKKSVLYYFYLASFKIFFAYYPNLEIKDEIPLNTSFGGAILWIQDFLAPFIVFLKSGFYLKYPETENDNLLNNIRLNSSISRYISGKKISELSAEINISENTIRNFNVKGNKILLNADIS